MAQAALVAGTTTGRLRLFALDAAADLGAEVARRLDQPLTPHEELAFADGESKARPLEAIDGDDVYVLQRLHSDERWSAEQKLCRLLFFIGACKDAGAARVTAVVPYLCFSRQDRRVEPQDPVTTRYVGALFEAAGADVLVSLDVHEPTAFENAFSRRTVAVTATPLFVDYVRGLPDETFCVVSPDIGGAKRAERFRSALEAALERPVSRALVEKHRKAGGLSGELFVGDVAGATALILDDLISSGGTLARAARQARGKGARRVIALAAHGLFTADAHTRLSDPAFERIVVLDTARSGFAGADSARLEVLSSASLLADVIARLRDRRALDDLLAG